MGEQQSQGHWLELPQFSETWNAEKLSQSAPQDTNTHSDTHTHSLISNEWDELLPRVLQKGAY